MYKLSFQKRTRDENLLISDFTSALEENFPAFTAFFTHLVFNVDDPTEILEEAYRFTNYFLPVQ